MVPERRPALREGRRTRQSLLYFVDLLLPWLRGRPWTTCLLGLRFFLVLYPPLACVTRQQINSTFCWLIIGTYRSAPDRDRMHIALTLTPTTTMRMVRSIHSQTSHRRSYIQPSAPSSFAQLPKLPMRITRYTNRSTRIFMHFSNLSTLQSYCDISYTLPDLIAGNDGSISTCAPTKNRTSQPPSGRSVPPPAVPGSAASRRR